MKFLSSDVFIRILYLLSALVLWGVAYLVGSIIVDGFQSIGAISDSHRPLDLHWPLVGSYLGYDATWGFHWPGWPLLRSLLFPVLSWSPVSDLLLLALVWAATAWQIYSLELRNGSRFWAVLCGLLSILAPGIIITLQNYRPEIVTALLLTICLRCWFSVTIKGRISLALALIVLPITHPLGSVVPASWLLWSVVGIMRRESFYKSLFIFRLQSVCLLMGAILLVSWYAAQPVAWQQLLTNLESQRLLSEGMGINHLTFFRWMFGRVTSLPLGILIFVSLIYGAKTCFSGFSDKSSPICDSCSKNHLVLSCVGIISAFFFNWVVKNANSHHLVSVMPLMIWIFVSAVKDLKGAGWCWQKFFIISIFFALSNALLLKYIFALWKNNGKSYRSETIEALSNLPPCRKIWIPIAFWEAAQISSLQQKTIYQFSTFPNVLERSKRCDYEKRVVSDMQKGDLLIWDPLQEHGGVFNFVEITALKHKMIHPSTQSDNWEYMQDIFLNVTYSKGQSKYFKVYRKK